MSPTKMTGGSTLGARRFKLLPAAIVVFVLLAGLWLGTTAVSPPAASARMGDPFGTSNCRPSSTVGGVIRNDTDVPLRQLSAGNGVSNVWCEFPPKVIAPHTTGSFEAGDLVFETFVEATYRSDNGDVISLFAASRLGGRAEGSCSVSQGSHVKCHSIISHNERDGGNNTDAKFTVTPYGGPNQAR
jgi:hypothetical protein